MRRCDLFWCLLGVSQPPHPYNTAPLLTAPLLTALLLTPPPIIFAIFPMVIPLVFTPLPKAGGLGEGGGVTTNFTLSQEQILAAKVENRKEKEKEHQMDHEQMSAEDEALKRMLDLEDMDEDNETEEEEEEEVGTVKKKKRKKKIAVQDEDSNDVPDEEEVEEEIEEEIEEKEDEDEMINRRAEKILQGNNSL